MADPGASLEHAALPQPFDGAQSRDRLGKLGLSPGDIEIRGLLGQDLLGSHMSPLRLRLVELDRPDGLVSKNGDLIRLDLEDPSRNKKTFFMALAADTYFSGLESGQKGRMTGSNPHFTEFGGRKDHIRLPSVER